MFGSGIFDIVIGVVLLYLVLALAVTALQELVESLLRVRARYLKAGIEALLQDRTFAQQVMKHPLLDGLAGGAKASYIPGRAFAAALIGTLTSSAGADFQALRNSVTTNPSIPEKLKPALLALVQQAESSVSSVVSSAMSSVQAFQVAIERWFDDAMDRVSGWFKRWAQWWVLGFSAVLCVVFNADTLEIGRTLKRDATLRASIIAMAERAVNAPSIVLQNTSAQTPSTRPAGADAANDAAQEWVTEIRAARGKLERSLENIEKTGIPLGWKGHPKDWFEKVLGLLVTILAVSLGAPFWFDVLSKVMRVRTAGKRPASETDSAPRR